MKLKLYLMGYVLFLVSAFSEAIPVSSDDVFQHVIYDYNYHKFIAVGNKGTVATSVDGKKWISYVAREIDDFLVIESSTSAASGVSVLTTQKLYNFDPDTGQFTLKQTFSDEALLMKVDVTDANVFYRASRMTNNSTRVGRCTRPEAGGRYT